MDVPRSKPLRPNTASERAERTPGAGSDSNAERPATRKQAAVTGDMCPMGAPPTLPEIPKPRCSIDEWTPREENTKRTSAATTATALATAQIRTARRSSTGRARRPSTAPCTTSRKAVLGAMGMRPEPKLESKGTSSSHPSRAMDPSAAMAAPDARTPIRDHAHVP